MRTPAASPVKSSNIVGVWASERLVRLSIEL